MNTNKVFYLITIFLLITSSCSQVKNAYDPETREVSKHAKPYDEMPTYVDPRDGNKYNIIQIGDQIWMKENLKWLPSISGPSDDSHIIPHYYVYNYSDNNIAKAKHTEYYDAYGVLYNWPAAIEACPPGWKLPSQEDFFNLEDYITNNYKDINQENLSSHLMSARKVRSSLGGDFQTRTHPRWSKKVSPQGIDSFGFSFLPGGLFIPRGVFFYNDQPGRHFSNGQFCGIGHNSIVWTDKEISSSEAIAYFAPTTNQNYALCTGYKSYAYSVRCIKESSSSNHSSGSNYQFDLIAYHNWKLERVPLSESRLINIGFGIGLGVGLGVSIIGGFNSAGAVILLSSITSFSGFLINNLIGYDAYEYVYEYYRKREESNWFADPEDFNE